MIKSQKLQILIEGSGHVFCLPFTVIILGQMSVCVICPTVSSCGYGPVAQHVLPLNCLRGGSVGHCATLQVFAESVNALSHL